MISLLRCKQILQPLSLSSLRHFIEHLPYTTKTSPNPTSFFYKTSNQTKRLDPPKASENLLDLLKDYGFSEPQTSILLARCPLLLRINIDRTLVPKLRFFRSLGFSDAELAKMLCLWSTVLNSSVVNRYMPNLKLVKSILQDDAKVRRCIKKCPLILSYDLEGMVLPRIKALRNFGVTNAVVKVLFGSFPQAIVFPLRDFHETFDAIKGLGITPSKSMFAHAFATFGQTNEKEWERKLENYRMLGWSREQVMHAFIKHPSCMALSDEKRKKNAEFFKEKLQWGPEYISMYPALLSYSFEKRIQPRFLLLEYLKSKGLFKSKVVGQDIQRTDEDFIARYVIKYQSECPELLQLIGGSQSKLESFFLTIPQAE